MKKAKNYQEVIGETIEQMRLQKGWTQGDLAEAVGSSQSAIHRIEKGGLTDISRHATGRNGAKATYRFQGEWGSLDHIFASEAMTACVAECYVFDAPFLLEDDETYGGVKPRRNYNGPNYMNGFSDHLPLVARFRFHEK